MTAATGRPLVVCYGGTFDPVHLGHVGAALDVLERSACEALHVVPAALPPHRGRPGANAEQRLRMLELAFGEAACTDAMASRLRIDRIELERAGPSYTVDTLKALRRELGPDVALGWVLGTDALAGIERWHRWREIVDAAHLLVLERPGHPLPEEGAVGELVAARRVTSAEALRSNRGGSVWCVGQRPVSVSATEVRARLDGLARTGASGAALDGVCDGLLSPAVWAYIRREGLYGVRRA